MDRKVIGSVSAKQGRRGTRTFKVLAISTLLVVVVFAVVWIVARGFHGP